MDQHMGCSHFESINEIFTMICGFTLSIVN